jgi:hypothetical protein
MTSDREAFNADWRELAQRIQEENDSEKIVELARKLIAKFDEEAQRKRLRLLESLQSPPED